MEVVKGIYQIRFPHGNSWLAMYLLRYNRIVLIDTGTEDSIETSLYPFLRGINLKPSDLSIIVNTHCHNDHMGGNAKLKEETAAKLALNELSVAKSINPRSSEEAIWDPLEMYVVRENPYFPRSAAADIVLKEGDCIDMGGSALVLIQTPGHESDCVCFYDPLSKSLFTGDSVFGKGLIPGIAFYQDLSSYKRSLNRLLKFVIEDKVKTICMGHPFDPYYEGIARGEEADDSSK